MKVIEIPQLLPSGGRLTGYLHEPDDFYVHRGRRPAIVVFPGGGYQKLAEREADPVAFEFFAAGFNTFILRYSVRDESRQDPPLGLTPLAQASQALVTIRNNAAEWNTRENQVAVLGFSAGGHLAASCAALWDLPELQELVDTEGARNRPDAAVLGYAVTVAGEYTHEPSIANLVKNLAGEAVMDPYLFDLTKHVKRNTPPCFIWSTVADELVPVENSLLFAQALRQWNIPFELHLYPDGRHGLTLGMMETNESHPHLASWVKLCKEWLGDLFRFPISI